MSLVPAAVANYLLGVVYQLTGSPLNFFPALFATIIIAVALQSLFMVRYTAWYINTTIIITNEVSCSY